MKRKLNSKGFTLIELLAVIIILALIMVISIPQVLKAMNSSRVSSLHSKAKSVVSWYSEGVAADALLPTTAADTERDIPKGVVDFVNTATSWTCISTAFADAAELDTANYNISTGTATAPDAITTGNECSAIKLTSAGKLEVLLVAKSTGKFSVGGKIVYAYSGDEGGVAK